MSLPKSSPGLAAAAFFKRLRAQRWEQGRSAETTKLPAGSRKSLGRSAADFVYWRARHCVEYLVQPYLSRSIAEPFHSFASVRQLRATADSIDYADTYMQGAAAYSNKREVLGCGVDAARREGVFLEFGVWSGRTINFIAERHSGPVHGFDSFEGLPEDWVTISRSVRSDSGLHGSPQQKNMTKGMFNTAGKLPEVRPNVHLHVGWFDETLPRFVTENTEPVAFLHVDCDLYSSTRTIFQYLGDRIDRGTVIVFDEYFNYAGWREHEYKAFQEFISNSGQRYRYLAYNECEMNVAVLIE